MWTRPSPKEGKASVSSKHTLHSHLSMDIIEAFPAAAERLAEYLPWSGTANPGSTPSSSKSFAVLTPTRCGLLEVRPHDDGRRGDRPADIFTPCCVPSSIYVPGTKWGEGEAAGRERERGSWRQNEVPPHKVNRFVIHRISDPDASSFNGSTYLRSVWGCGRGGSACRCRLPGGSTVTRPTRTNAT